jgi:hypothetical protein
MPVFPDVLGFWVEMWLSSTFVISLQGFRDALCKRVLEAKCNARQMQRKKGNVPRGEEWFVRLSFFLQVRILNNDGPI